MKEITIIRHRYTPWGVDGRLEIDGQPICDTVEHPVRHLPAGRYSIKFELYRALKKKMPFINLADWQRKALNLTTSRGGRVLMPCIKSGNGPMRNTDGSIIVGEHLVAGVLGNSDRFFERIHDLVKKWVQRDNNVFLIIKDGV